MGGGGGISWEATDTRSFKEASRVLNQFVNPGIVKGSLLTHLPTIGNLPLALSWIYFCSMSCKSPDP